ncbi:MAG: WcaF family extracellular polysaccharide biosynthesis acetyltransferase [Desulfuromonadaceae bacterium]|nr:WcaF family extracellular polysaccharide biosynthesis acetyltransferase [Desulfuromonadaceae bacterium]
MKVDFSKFDNLWYKPGRSIMMQVLWYFINVLFLKNPLNPSSGLKVMFLRIFGAQIGKCVVIKPSISVKYPWNLKVGDYSWIGEYAWFDSLDTIKIGCNCCISQGAYFCTGNHDWTDPAFGLIVKPIIVEDGGWVGARATVLPGVTIGTHSIITAGSVVSKDTEPYMIYSGNPLVLVKKRVICTRR